MEYLATTFIFIVVGLACILVVTIVAVVLFYKSRQKKKIDTIKSTGIRGEAIVLDYQVTPTDSESDDIAWVRLEMRVPELESYILEKRTPLRYAGLLKKDMIVSVWVDKNDPKNPDKVVIEIQKINN